MPRLNIKDVARAHRVSPVKSLGQNFLTDNGVIDDIVSAAKLKDGAHVLEIGAGLGNMTRALLLSSAVKKVTIIEFDKRCIEALQVMRSTLSNPSKLNIIQGDALKMNEEELEPPLSIVSNLPYNIGTKLLIKWLNKLSLFDSITLMLQKEVVDRIVAKPRTSAYGRLSVFVQLLCSTEKVFDVPREAFWPMPKVESSIVRLIPREKPLYDCEIDKLEYLCRMAFAQRRKFLLNNLKTVFGARVKDIFDDLNLNYKARAEELSVEQFCYLSQLI